jgi:hypothetical protein
MEKDKITTEEVFEQVNLKLYDLFSNPEKHKEEWEKFGITQETADKEIKIFHERYGVPDMSLLEEN